METDGGGYTMLAVRNGPRTRRLAGSGSDVDAAAASAPGGGGYTDGCTARGLRLAVPRTRAHFGAMLSRFGLRYFRVVPGIFGIAAGNFSAWAMNSGTAHVARTWRAIDGGSWWLRDTPYSQPSGDYVPGCWLGLVDPFFNEMDGTTAADAATAAAREGDASALADSDNDDAAAVAAAASAPRGERHYEALLRDPSAQLAFDDDGCEYSATDYVCSTNDKDPAVPFEMWLAQLPEGRESMLAPPRAGGGGGAKAAVAGDYVISYRVRNRQGVPQCEVLRRTVIVSDNMRGGGGGGGPPVTGGGWMAEVQPTPGDLLQRPHAATATLQLLLAATALLLLLFFVKRLR
jgi:hypothetical protein